jgi:hypothetical protein
MPKILLAALLAVLMLTAAAPRARAATDGGHVAGTLHGRLGDGTLLRVPPRLAGKDLQRVQEGTSEEGDDAFESPGPRRTPRIPSRPATGDPAGLDASAAADDDFTLFRNQPTGSGAAEVGEPSWANAGNAVLFTGNWGAAVSPDNGLSWSYVDPRDLEPDVPSPELDNGFCCDQNTLAVQHGDTSLVLWEQITVKDASDSHVRLATYQGADELASQSDYCIQDWSPADFGFGTGTWFDFPYLAATDKYVYLSANVNKISGGFVDSVVWRVPISELDSDDCTVTGVRYYTHSTKWGTALAQGSGSTEYWAYHDATNDQLDIWALDDSTVKAIGHTVTISDYQKSGRGSAHCPVPDGTDPCQRMNDRILSGWRRSGEVGWAWNVAEGGSFPFPHVRIARISTATFTVIDEPDVWNPDYAWSYGSLAADDRGDVGVSLYRIGGGSYPRARVAIVDDVDPSWASLTMHGIITSNFGTTKNSWGDYVTTHPYQGCPNTWGAAVNSMQTSSNDGGGEQRFAWFGRERDGCPDLTITSATVAGELVFSGRPLSIDATMRNTGSTSTPASSTALYLSRDTLPGEGDVRLGVVAAGALAPGASEAAHADLPAAGIGTYYLLACADDTGAAAEISETDNCLASPTTITVAVTAAALAAVSVSPRPIHPGARLAIDYELRGRGGRAAVSLRLARQAGGVVKLAGDRATLPHAGAGKLSHVHRRLHRPAPKSLRPGRYHVTACVAQRCLTARELLRVY